MLRHPGKTFLLFLVTFLAIGVFQGCGSDDDDDNNGCGTSVGDESCNITGIDQNGNTVNLTNYRGQVILVDFSTRWCEPCQREAQKAEDLFQAYRAQGFQIITVLTEGRVNGQESTIEDLQAWAQQYGLTFPVINDPGKVAWNNFRDVNEYPLNMVIDRNFIIRYKQHGYDENAILAAIQAAL